MSTVAFCEHVHLYCVSIHSFPITKGIFLVWGAFSLFYFFSTISILYNAMNFLLLENTYRVLKMKKNEEDSTKEPAS